VFITVMTVCLADVVNPLYERQRGETARSGGLVCSGLYS